MRMISNTEFRAKYAETLDAVIDDREEVVVTGRGREPIVLVAKSEYDCLVETAHLLRTPANARQLLDAIAELEAGGGEVNA